MCYVSVIQTVKDVTLQVFSKNESRHKTVIMLDENNRTNNPEEVCEGSTVEHPGCKLEHTSAEPMPEELFILSFIVIPPTLDEGRSFRQSSSHLWQHLSHILMDGQSASESREVSHLLITDALVPVSEDEEKKSEQGDVGKSRNGELKHKIPVSTSQGNTKDESQADHLWKDWKALWQRGLMMRRNTWKRKIPERTRIAKLQVKPIPVSRRNTRGGDAKEDTAALSFKQTTGFNTRDKLIEAPNQAPKNQQSTPYVLRENG
ncbi:uncharacterized protein zgc:162472 isoform X2 [Carassius gibelio]|uniref:uncharacterized protein zgc:162472 isoform X2 n=1 Tax=Carassius gibelio TaxID=101364 RepID=UPI002278E513|nr:uncharacterized protein zgc:162472 isoform X2 [Carassius gibelio]